MSKTNLKATKGFTPLIDALVQSFGITEAAVFGRMWRYCQMADGRCRAAQQTIADELNISVSTVYRSIKFLCEAGYLEDTTPDLKNRPHIYADTGKAMLSVELSFDAEIPPVSQNDTVPLQNEGAGYVKMTDEDSIEDTLIREKSGIETKTVSLPQSFSIENQLYVGSDKIQMPNFRLAEMQKAADVIARVYGHRHQDVYDIAMAFMTARDIVLLFEDNKGNRKAAKGMIASGVKPIHIHMAVKELQEKAWHMTDLHSVRKTAIDLANPAKTSEVNNPMKKLAID